MGLFCMASKVTGRSDIPPTPPRAYFWKKLAPQVDNARGGKHGGKSG